MNQNIEEMWIVKSRPRSLDEMLVTEEMNEFINNIRDNHILLYGPIGSGKTVFAEALTGFKGRTITCRSLSDIDEIIKIVDQVNSIIVRNINEYYPSVEDILNTYKSKKVIFVTRDEASAELAVFNQCTKIHTNQFLPKNNLSLKHYQKYLELLLETNQIAFDNQNEQFQLNALEMYEKLWPKMRQIVRHAQIRSKSKKWTPIPV